MVFAELTWAEADVSARINRCLSSCSSSASDAPPSSNASARVWSSSLCNGSCASNRREVGEEVRDLKDGGGEEGACCGDVGLS